MGVPSREIPAEPSATGEVAPPGERDPSVNLRARTSRLWATAGATLLFALLVAAGPAAAADPAAVTLNGGCTIGLTSLDETGGVIDSAIGPGAASKDNPLNVTLSGEVVWEGTAPLISSGTYQVNLNALPIPGFGGPFVNKDSVTSASGTADVGSIIVFGSVLDKFLSLVWNVSGSVTGSGGACSGEVWIRTGSADPLFSGGAIGGLALGALGGLGVLKSLKGRHALRGLAAGLILGIALALLVLTFGVYVAGPLTPWAVLGGVPILGFILGLIEFG